MRPTWKGSNASEKEENQQDDQNGLKHFQFPYWGRNVRWDATVLAYVAVERMIKWLVSF
jgi:hypothetical protein